MGTFVGQVPTPNLDRLARSGLRYTRFHTTALRLPTRAALLTGRNHHSVATGTITELGDSFSGYEKSVPIRYSLDKGIDVGEDTGTPVNLSYDVPFKFTGKIDKVTINLEPIRAITSDENS